MLMTRWVPGNQTWHDLNRLHDEMNRLVDRFGVDEGTWPTLAVSYPALNVWEDLDHLYAEAELPGMELDDHSWLRMRLSGKKPLNHGDQADALIALAMAGCKFYCAYPMSPATHILEWMAAHGEELGICVRNDFRSI